MFDEKIVLEEWVSFQKKDIGIHDYPIKIAKCIKIVGRINKSRKIQTQKYV